MKMNEMKFYHVVQTNEEGNDWVVVIGNLLATPRHFATKEEAEEWASNPKWEMIVAMILFVMEKQNQINKIIKSVKDGND